MRKFGSKSNLKAWIVFAVAIIAAFGLLQYIKSVSGPTPIDEAIIQPDTPDTSGGRTKPGKGFVTEELTAKEKAENDSAALSDALGSADLKSCENIKYDEELRKKCMDNINYVAFLKIGDEKQCTKLFDLKLRQQCYDNIYFNAAKNALDISLCNKISKESSKENCINQIKVVLGRTAESAESCNSITNSILKQECLNNYYYSESIKKMEMDTCENISDPKLKERCGKTITNNLEVAEASKKAVAMAASSAPVSAAETLQDCDKLAADKMQECKDSANYKLAYEEKSLTYCNRIADSAKKQECNKEQGEKIDQFYLRQAMTTGNASLCSKIINSDLKTLCTDSV